MGGSPSPPAGQAAVRTAATRSVKRTRTGINLFRRSVTDPPETRAGRHVERFQRWPAHAEIRSAGAGTGAYRVERLDGTAREIAPEDAVRVTEKPTLVRYR